jgi:hypothetical protein
VANAATAAIKFTFIDRDRNEAAVTMYLPFAVSVDDALEWSYSTVSQFSALSNALVVRIQVSYKHTIDDPGLPDPQSNTRQNVMLFVENDQGDINALVVPSPRPLIFEQAGPYAGIRLDLAGAAAVQFQAGILAYLLRTEDNRQFGTTLLTGGLAL